MHHHSDKIILVTGATGNQGGATAEALLKNKKFKVRVMVRDPSKEQAKKLHALGAEVVKGDFDDKASLQAAFKGVYGVFNTQNSWQVGVENELKQGKLVADVAKEAGVKVFLHSGLDDNREIGLPTAHADVKKDVERYAISLGLPVAVVSLTFFLQNFTSNMKPKKDGDTYVFSAAIPDNIVMAWVDASDVGPVSAHMFEHPEKYIGRTLYVAGDLKTFPELVQIFTKVTGKKARYQSFPVDVIRKSGMPHAEDLSNMFAAFAIKDMVKLMHMEELKKLHPNLNSIESFFTSTNYTGDY